jgi:hypothetical protein
MIDFVSNTNILKIFEKDEVRVNFLNKYNNIVIFTDYDEKISGISGNRFSNAINYRINYPKSIIIYISFLPLELIRKHDKYGILSLAGTVFIRFPFWINDLYEQVEDCFLNKANILQNDWKKFASLTISSMLRDRIEILRHRNKLDLVNYVTGPLRAAAIDSPKIPELFQVVKELLSKINIYIECDEIKEIFYLVNMSDNLEDDYLHSVKSFKIGLQKLQTYTKISKRNISNLISDIDFLNESLSKIK